MPSIRTVVRWSALLLALAGWGGSLWSWLDHGYAAGVHPGFITALSVGITATLVAGQWWLLPSKQEREERCAVYAMGYRDGLYQPVPVAASTPAALKLAPR